MASGGGGGGGVASAISVGGRDDSSGAGSEEVITWSSITGSGAGATGSGSIAASITGSGVGASGSDSVVTGISSSATGAVGAGSTGVTEGTGSSSKNRLADPFAEMSCDAEAGASGSMSAEQTKSTAARN